MIKQASHLGELELLIFGVLHLEVPAHAQLSFEFLNIFGAGQINVGKDAVIEAAPSHLFGNVIVQQIFFHNFFKLIF
jgi:hypothetical protein